MTTCDTTGMYKAIEPQITGTYNHLIYYFKQSNLCDFGGLGEEGSALKPAKRTWMNGSLSCVVLMQEPGHNLGLMHANTMKCGTSSFTTTPARRAPSPNTAARCRRWAAAASSSTPTSAGTCNWLSGCNGVECRRTARSICCRSKATVPAETGIQVLQVPSRPRWRQRSAGDDHHCQPEELLRRAARAGGTFDAYSTSPRGVPSRRRRYSCTSATTCVRRPQPAAGTEQRVDRAAQHEPRPGTAYRRAHHRRDRASPIPAGGPTITLQSISATGATIVVSNPNGERARRPASTARR